MVEITGAVGQLDDVADVVGLETEISVEVEDGVCALETDSDFIAVFEALQRL